MSISTHVFSPSEIPEAPYYVLCTDKFMSGWGMAEGKTNVLIFPCADTDEVRIVTHNLHAREEMKRVRVAASKPRLLTSWYAQVLTKDESPNFYVEGYFS